MSENVYKERLDQLRKALRLMWYSNSVNFSDAALDVETLAFTDPITGEWLPPFDWDRETSTSTQRKSGV